MTPRATDRRSTGWASATRSLAVAAALVLAPVVASSCGSGDDETQAASTTARPTTTSEPAPSTSSSTTSSTAPSSTTESTVDESAVGPNPPLGLPTTVTELAAALSRAEATVRDPALSLDQLDAWGAHQQALYRRLTFHPDWVEPVMAAVDAEYAEAVALNWEARQNLEALLATERLHDTLPAWRIVEPSPADELLTYYKEAESITGIEWEYVAAINLVETRMGRIRGVSTAGAVGPMQFLPTTWAECCEGDPTDPHDAIIGAATYLTHRGGPDNMAKAIWGYNNSDYYVNAVTAYARVMMDDERAYHGYHGWGVYFLTTEGLVTLPVGYEEPVEVPVTEWLARNPGSLVTG